MPEYSTLESAQRAVNRFNNELMTCPISGFMPCDKNCASLVKSVVHENMDYVSVEGTLTKTGTIYRAYAPRCANPSVRVTPGGQLIDSGRRK